MKIAALDEEQSESGCQTGDLQNKRNTRLIESRIAPSGNHILEYCLINSCMKEKLIIQQNVGGTSLKLVIDDAPNLKLLLVGSTNLKYVSISNCPLLESITFDRLDEYLGELRLHNLPLLVDFVYKINNTAREGSETYYLMDMFPTNLKVYISNVPKFGQRTPTTSYSSRLTPATGGSREAGIRVQRLGGEFGRLATELQELLPEITANSTDQLTASLSKLDRLAQEIAAVTAEVEQQLTSIPQDPTFAEQGITLGPAADEFV